MRLEDLISKAKQAQRLEQGLFVSFLVLDRKGLSAG